MELFLQGETVMDGLDLKDPMATTSEEEVEEEDKEEEVEEEEEEQETSSPRRGRPLILPEPVRCSRPRFSDIRLMRWHVSAGVPARKISSSIRP